MTFRGSRMTPPHAHDLRRRGRSELEAPDDAADHAARHAALDPARDPSLEAEGERGVRGDLARHLDRGRQRRRRLAGRHSWRCGGPRRRRRRGRRRGRYREGETKKAFATRSFSGGRGSAPSSGRTTTAAAATACSETVSGHAHAPPSGAALTRVAKRRGRGAGPARTGEPMRPDHQIAMGSITKTVTAALVLRLAQEGRLDLDDAVGRWLGALDNVPPQITLRQLLNHTCGLGNYSAHPAFAATVASDPSRSFDPRELLGLFLPPPAFPPGAATEYTNTAFVVLGLVAEAAGQRGVAAAWRERFWGPLGLEEVFLPLALAGATDGSSRGSPAPRPSPGGRQCGWPAAGLGGRRGRATRPCRSARRRC